MSFAKQKNWFPDTTKRFTVLKIDFTLLNTRSQLILNRETAYLDELKVCSSEPKAIRNRILLFFQVSFVRLASDLLHTFDASSGFALSTQQESESSYRYTKFTGQKLND